MKFLNSNIDFQIGDAVRKKDGYDWYIVSGFYQSEQYKGSEVYDWILFMRKDDGFDVCGQAYPSELTREF